MADQSATDQSGLKAADLQVAKLDGTSFGMNHSMGLVNIKMGAATAAGSKNTLTLNGNTTNTKYYTTTNDNAFYALDEFVTNLPYKSGSRNTPTTLSCYFIVNPSKSYTFSTPYKYADADANKQWNDIIVSSSSNTVAKGKYREITTSVPKFKNLARLYTYTGAVQPYSPIMAGFKYQMECWGASGGDLTQTYAHGGKGGYTVGVITISNTGQDYYVYVGSRPLGEDASGNPIYAIDSDYPNWSWAVYGNWRNSTAYKWAANMLPGWNGGGEGTTNTDPNGPQTGAGGGGATDIRLNQASTTTTTWYSFSSMKTRIMVAAGGGATCSGRNGGEAISVIAGGYAGAAGGITGYDGTDVGTHEKKYSGTGASQTEGGNIHSSNPEYAMTESDREGDRLWDSSTRHWHSTMTEEFQNREDRVLIHDSGLNKGTFGQGATNLGWAVFLGGGGAGGGWYGGGAGNRYHGAAGGGSSFIAGMSGCKAVDQSATEPNYTTNPGASVTMRNDATTTIGGTTYSFNSAKMIDGKGYQWTSGAVGALTQMPNPRSSTGLYASGEGHTGNGYARITILPYN